jgi:hypothetical protein
MSRTPLPSTSSYLAATARERRIDARVAKNARFPSDEILPETQTARPRVLREMHRGLGNVNSPPSLCDSVRW